jgi:dihydrofolate reductase
MRKLVVSMWITLDGFIAGPNGAMDWVNAIFDEAMANYEAGVLSTADTLVLGRITYQSFAGAFTQLADNPSAAPGERDYARKMNAMRKVVFSKTLDKGDWNNSLLLREVSPEQIKQLKQEPGQNMLIYGSASIVQALTSHGLIDEYQLLVHPVVLGDGKPLFADAMQQTKLDLLKTKTHPSGVVVLYYQPAHV